MEHPTIHHLFEYQDGTLDPGTASAVKLHLDTCADCSRELEIQDAITRSARQALSAAHQPKLEERILAFAETSIPAPKRMRRFELSPGNIGFALFVAAFIVITSMVLLNAKPEPDSGSVVILASDAVTVLETWSETVTSQLKSILSPLRVRSADPSISTIMLATIVLLVLFFVDRFLLRFLQRPRS